MPKMFLGIPVLNRIDLLEQALATHDFEHELFVVNNNTVDQAVIDRVNALKKAKGFDMYSPRFNIGVAASWNRIWMTAMAKGYEYCYITANDLFMEPGAMKAFFEMPKASDEGLWLANHFNFFCIRVSDVTRLGWFDECFYPGYYEDNDFAYRVTLAGLRIVQAETFPGVKTKHLGSQTIASDPTYAHGNNQTFGSWNATHFSMKWGGPPGRETFRVPYNDKTKDLRWWPDPAGTIAVRDWDNAKRAEKKAV